MSNIIATIQSSDSVTYPDQNGGEVISSDVSIQLTDSVTGLPVAGNGVSVTYHDTDVGDVTVQITGSNTSKQIYSGTTYEVHYDDQGNQQGAPYTRTFSIANPVVGTRTIHGDLSISFAYSPGAPSYRIKYRKVGDNAYTTAPSEATASPAVITGLDISFQYEVTIEANCGNGTYSAPIAFTTGIVIQVQAKTGNIVSAVTPVKVMYQINSNVPAQLSGSPQSLGSDLQTFGVIPGVNPGDTVKVWLAKSADDTRIKYLQGFVSGTTYCGTPYQFVASTVTVLQLIAFAQGSQGNYSYQTC
jgi:hypothetical protein